MKKRTKNVYIKPGKTFFILMSIIVFLIVGYVYFIGSSVVQVVLRGEIDAEIEQTHARVSELETQYLELKEEIDLDLAYSLGFENIGHKQFVTKTTLSVVANDKQ